MENKFQWNFTQNVQIFSQGKEFVKLGEQGKYEGFDSCDRPSNLTQIGLKSLISQPLWPWNLMDDLEKL